MLTSQSFAQPADGLQSKCVKAFNLASKNTSDIAIDDVHYTCKINGLDNSIIYLFALSPTKYEDDDKDFGYYDLTAYLLLNDSITKKSTFKDFHISDWGNKFTRMAIDKVDYDLGDRINGIGLLFETSANGGPYEVQSTKLFIFGDYESKFSPKGWLPIRDYTFSKDGIWSEEIIYTMPKPKDNVVKISSKFSINGKYTKTKNGKAVNKLKKTRMVSLINGELSIEDGKDFPECSLC
jgi:hypothetical protein